MPYVNIKLTPPGVSAEDKAKLIAGVSDLLQEVLNKDPQYTYVVIEEIPQDSWGAGGISLAEHYAKAAE